MNQPNIFDVEVREALLKRVTALKPDTTPIWGKMNVTEMMAHCSLVFEFNNGQRNTSVNPIMKLVLKPMMRKVIIGPQPYKKNSPTAPYFKIADTHEFELEQERLINNVKTYSIAGPDRAEQLKHAWLGELPSNEWSWAMYKHLDHHLNQFGV